MRRRLIHTVLAVLLSMNCWSRAAIGEGTTIPTAIEATKSESLFIERLMAAESRGLSDTKNRRSTAVGAFQFIESTFIEIIQRNFPELAQGKTPAQIMDLRKDVTVSRNAALIYTRRNAAFLATRGFALTGTNLRLAFFVGPTGAQKVLTAKPDAPLSEILGKGAIDANPFLNALTAGELIERATRETAEVALLPQPEKRSEAPGQVNVNVSCNLKLASCRKWVALAKKRAARPDAPLFSVTSAN